MGFLGNLNKVNTLELFLTDKGKELMLKENGLGLQDLISRFSLDDSDYDYRRTSNVWIDGITIVGLVKTVVFHYLVIVGLICQMFVVIEVEK
jgi:hypothetical protein